MKKTKKCPFMKHRVQANENTETHDVFCNFECNALTTKHK